MDKNADPIESIIEFAWACGADRFWVNNAKDELKKLKEKSKEMSLEAFKANQFAVEQTNQYLEQVERFSALKESLDQPVAYAKINNHGDLYDLRLTNNPYDNQEKVIPLYRINHEQ